MPYSPKPAVFRALLSGAALALAVSLLVHSCVSPPPAPPVPSPPAPAQGDALLLLVLLASVPPGGAFDIRIEDGTARLSPDAALSGTVAVAREGEGISVAGRACAPSVRLEGLDGALFALGNRRYAGALRLDPDAGSGIRVVNEVPLETYLEGVVGGEMPPSWEMEALKAQAVAARTYAAARARDASARERAFDLFDDTRSQVYVGVPSGPHAGRVREAVASTRGEVLVHDGRLLTAYFHSTCGGHTEDASRVFGVHGVAPLRGAPCPYCADSPAFRWEARVPAARLESLLGVGAIVSISPVDPGPSGRCARVEVEGSQGRTAVPSKDFRREIGYTVLKSTAFEAAVEGEEIAFSGKGYGHGVGLCQWGARGQARAGRSYLDILEHYYPGALLLQAQAVMGTGRR